MIYGDEKKEWTPEEKKLLFRFRRQMDFHRVGMHWSTPAWSGTNRQRVEQHRKVHEEGRVKAPHTHDDFEDLEELERLNGR